MKTIYKREVSKQQKQYHVLKKNPRKNIFPWTPENISNLVNPLITLNWVAVIKSKLRKLFLIIVSYKKAIKIQYAILFDSMLFSSERCPEAIFKGKPHTSLSVLQQALSHCAIHRILLKSTQWGLCSLDCTVRAWTLYNW